MKFKSLSTLLDKNKILPFYWERKDLDKIKSPVSIEFHWTSNCNYDCVHCSYGSRRETTNYLSKETINLLIKDVCSMGVQAVYLSGGGEPTVIKGWHKYAEQLMDHNVKVALITNGVAIKEQQISTVQKMEYVAISVYSTYESRYKKITESNKFNQQFLLPKLIKKNNTETIIGARCVLNDINHDEVVSIYQKAMESDFDYIIFIPAIDYEGRGVLLSEKSKKNIKKVVEKNKELFDNNRTNITNMIKLDVNHYQENNYLENLTQQPDGCKCIQIGTSAFINYDGGVYLCQPDIGNKSLQIGNVNDQHFSQIWRSELHKQVVDNLNIRYDNGQCEHCRSISYNRVIYAFNEDYYKKEAIDPFV